MIGVGVGAPIFVGGAVGGRPRSRTCVGAGVFGVGVLELVGVGVLVADGSGVGVEVLAGGGVLVGCWVSVGVGSIASSVCSTAIATAS